MDRTRQYREAFVRWLRGKNIFESFRWITPTDPTTFKTADALIELRTGGEFKTEREFDEWARVIRQTDAMAPWAKQSKVKLFGDSPTDFPFIDAADMPRFEVKARTLLSGLESAVLWVGIMLIEAVLLFALGYVAFIRYDVR